MEGTKGLAGLLGTENEPLQSPCTFLSEIAVEHPLLSVLSGGQRQVDIDSSMRRHNVFRCYFWFLKVPPWVCLFHAPSGNHRKRPKRRHLDMSLSIAHCGVIQRNLSMKHVCRERFFGLRVKCVVHSCVRCTGFGSCLRFCAVTLKCHVGWEVL